VPGSHKFDTAPEYGRGYDAVTATMPSGSVMLFDSALWHGGGANVSNERRFAFSCAYCWGWMRQQENLQLGIPRETAQRFPRRLQELCGYSVYKGQFGHIDNRDPIELLGRERGKRMVWEATDVPSRQTRSVCAEIMRKQQAKARCRFDPKSSRFSLRAETANKPRPVLRARPSGHSASW
jgi:hypothetical protein